MENKLPDIKSFIPDLRNANPVRAPDEFESESIKKLKQGEPVIANFVSDEIRLVGGIRAGKSCLECHLFRETLSGKESGKDTIIKQPLKEDELIGAFSYRLKRAAKEAKVEENH